MGFRAHVSIVDIPIGIVPRSRAAGSAYQAEREWRAPQAGGTRAATMTTTVRDMNDGKAWDAVDSSMLVFRVGVSEPIFTGPGSATAC